MCFIIGKSALGVGFPTGRDSATFWDKGTEVPSLSRDKGTTGQAQNLKKGWDRLGQPVKIQARPVPWEEFELVPLSFCPGTTTKLLSLCPKKLHCPVPLETLVCT